MFSGYIPAWTHDWGIRDHYPVTTWPCCLLPGSPVREAQNEPRQSFPYPTQHGAAAAGWVICHASDITSQAMPRQRHARAGSRWYISPGSTGALASALQTAGLIIPSMWPHFQASRPSLKEAVLFLQVLLGNSLESKCSAIWGPGQGATAEDARRPTLGEEIKEFCYERWGRWDTYMESPPGDMSWTVWMQFCAARSRETLLEHRGWMKWPTVVPFQHDPFCESVVLW